VLLSVIEEELLYVNVIMVILKMDKVHVSNVTINVPHVQNKTLVFNVLMIPIEIVVVTVLVKLDIQKTQ